MKVWERIKGNPKKSFAIFIAVAGSFFTMLEQTGCAVLTHEQHQAIVNFFSAVF